MMRPAILSEFVNNAKEGEPQKWETEEVGPVVYHGMGTDYEQFQDGVRSFTTAIVELPDGTLESVQISLVRFDPPTVIPVMDKVGREMRP